MRALHLAALAPSLAAVACATPPPPTEGAPLVEVTRAARVAGDWRWVHESIDRETRRVEREHWQLERDGLTRLRGSYLREVEVSVLADDGLVFACNQRPSYRQVARFDVTGAVGPDGVELEEVGYQTLPSPCDPGVRLLGRYRARVDRTSHLVLTSDATAQRLWNGDGTPVPPLPAVETSLAGAWTWSMASWTADGMVQRELERWQLAVSGADVTGSYTRTVTIVDPAGRPIACAGADRYTYVDRFTLSGRAGEDGWRLHESTYTADPHPCLVGTPTRTLDEATASLEGEYLIVTWRGPRRQVLARPGPARDLPW